MPALTPLLLLPTLAVAQPSDPPGDGVSAATEAPSTEAPAMEATLPLPLAARAEALSQARLERAAMGTLGGWAVVNMAGGGVGWALAEDRRARGFHQMNLGWNTVNLAIAGLGLVGAQRTDWAAMSDADLLARQRRLRTAFLVNGGLDVLYVGAGLGVREWGRAKDDPLREGWGGSIAVQGAFLLGFDVVMAILQHRRLRRAGRTSGNP